MSGSLPDPSGAATAVSAATRQRTVSLGAQPLHVPELQAWTCNPTVADTIRRVQPGPSGRRAIPEDLVAGVEWFRQWRTASDRGSSGRLARCMLGDRERIGGRNACAGPVSGI
jgi:hypothetical protein